MRVQFAARLLAGSFLVTSLYLPQMSCAQAQDEAQTDAAESAEIGDIVVTAQKRSQSLRDVGLTIQAAGEEKLDSLGIRGPSDLGKLVSGFSYTESLYTTPVYTLRGVGLYDATFGSVPAVAVYSDQVPRNVPVMSSGLDLDLERVEVLKGPQGTLFGQSSTGGAINYIFNKPTDYFEAGMDLTYERFGRIDASGFVSGPIANGIKARLAVRGVEGGAWQYSVSRPDDKLGDQRKLTGRLTVDIEPTADLKITLMATGARDRSDPTAPQYLGTVFNTYSAAALAAANANPATANPFGFVDEAAYAAYTTPGSPGYDAAFLARQATLVSRLNGIDQGGQNGIAGARALLGTQTSPDSARAAEWSPGLLRRNNNSYYQFVGRADYDIGSGITLTNITSLARQKLDYAQDLDATVAAGLQIPAMLGDVKAFNQELRLSGNSPQLNWIVGGSYDNLRTTQDNQFDFGDQSTNNPVGIPFTTAFNAFTSRLRSFGLYGNVDYEVVEGLHLQGGVRWTRNEQQASYCYSDPANDTAQGVSKTFSILQRIFTGDPTLPDIQPGQCFTLGDGFNGTTDGASTITPLNLTQNESNWSFRAGASYKTSGGTLLYANVSQGYKAGVFSSIGAGNTKQYAPANREKVVAYEAGFKAPLLDRRVNLNSSVFYYRYSDKQVRARILDSVFGLLEKMVNVPKSYVFGIEGDLAVNPVDGLTLTASGTYLRARVDGQFFQTPDQNLVYNTQGYTGDFDGATLPFTPEFSGNFDAEYKWDVADRLSAFVGGNLVYQGSQNVTFVNDTLIAPDFKIASYTTVDLRAGFGASDGKWTVTVFGRNVFDKIYTTSISTLIDTRFRLTGRPATYGATLKVRI